MLTFWTTSLSGKHTTCPAPPQEPTAAEPVAARCGEADKEHQERTQMLFNMCLFPFNITCLIRGEAYPN
jgi:hypothetical protein